MGNGVVSKGNVYYLDKPEFSDFYEIYDSNMNYVRGTMVTSKDIPRGFIRIEEHREKIIDSLINN